MTQAELIALKEVRRYAAFENANFGDCTRPGQTIDGKTVDEFIKDRTRIYRQSWILPVLDDMIRKAEYQLGISKEKPTGWSAVTKDYSYFANIKDRL